MSTCSARRFRRAVFMRSPGAFVDCRRRSRRTQWPSTASPRDKEPVRRVARCCSGLACFRPSHLFNRIRFRPKLRNTDASRQSQTFRLQPHSTHPHTRPTSLSRPLGEFVKQPAFGESHVFHLLDLFLMDARCCSPLIKRLLQNRNMRHTHLLRD